MPKTLQAKYAAALEATGFQELTATRYVGCKAYRHPAKPIWIFFLGKGGSVRVGQNRVTCRAVSDKFKAAILDGFTSMPNPFLK